MSRVAGGEVDASLHGDGVFGALSQILELLGRFSKALVWACGFSKCLGSKSSIGLKCRVGSVVGRVIKRYKAALRGSWFRAGANVLKPNAKRDVVESGPEVSGADARKVSGTGSGSSPCLGFDQSSLLLEASSSAAVLGPPSSLVQSFSRLDPSPASSRWTLSLWRCLCTYLRCCLLNPLLWFGRMGFGRRLPCLLHGQRWWLPSHCF